MSEEDRKFLARLVASHKAVISEECKRKKLDKSEYYRVPLVWTRKLRKLSVRTCVLADFSKHSVQIGCTETMFNQKYNRYGVYKEDREQYAR